MKDNGLLRKYFSQVLHKDGRVNVSWPAFKFQSLEDYESSHIVRASRLGSKYYLKNCEDKQSVDTEVLLSQVYVRAGLKSAVYLPARGSIKVVDGRDKKSIFDFRREREGFSVVSDDVAVKSSTDYREYTQRVTGDSVLPPFFPELAGRSGYDFKNYFTKEGARDFIKMQLFDTAVGNFDRNLDNFLVDVDSQNRICGIRSYDYSAGARDNTGVLYENYFGSYVYPRTYEGMVDEFKSNETISQVMTPKEMSAELQSIDFALVAEDIEKSIDYKIETDLVKRFEDRTNDLASKLDAPTL